MGKILQPKLSVALAACLLATLTIGYAQSWNWIQPGDILYHPALYSDVGKVEPRLENLVFAPLKTTFGHVGLVDWYGYVIEALSEGVVRQYTIAEFIQRYAASIIPEVYVLRVRVPYEHRREVIDRAIRFAWQQVGKPYEIITFTGLAGKEVFGQSYYCSELVWAAYQVGSGAYQSRGETFYGYINLDAGDGDQYIYPALEVTPNEIFRSPWTYCVGVLRP